MCAKVRYQSRRQAKQAAKRAQHTGLSAYRCRDVECFGFWHVGHLPGVVRNGGLSRQGMYGA